MRTPTSEQCYAVAETFRQAIKRYPQIGLNMMAPSVNDNHTCGTVHCHGGTYALMKCDLTKTLDFLDGANQLAEDLGFSGNRELRTWAQFHEDLWGNSNGESMFSQRLAFYSYERFDGANNISDIADHWQEVGDRIKLTEI